MEKLQDEESAPKRPQRTVATVRVVGSMHFRVELVRDILHCELYGRETGDETQQFIRAVAAESLRTGCKRILVSVRASRPIFRVEQYAISEHLKRAAANPGYRVALLADSDELRASHQYVEVLARQQGVPVRSFRDASGALEWLRL